MTAISCACKIETMGGRPFVARYCIPCAVQKLGKRLQPGELALARRIEEDGSFHIVHRTSARAMRRAIRKNRELPRHDVMMLAPEDGSEPYRVQLGENGIEQIRVSIPA